MERKIIVFSDSHGSTSNLQKIFSLHRDADAFIHLGDGASEFSRLCRLFDKVGYSVLGNCDMGFSCPGAQSPYAVYNIGGCGFFMTHGHLYGVKNGREGLVSFVRERFPDTDIILYGHTHARYESYKDGIYIMNPGSCGRPRSGGPSYGIIDITEAGIAMHTVEI